MPNDNDTPGVRRAIAPPPTHPPNAVPRTVTLQRDGEMLAFDHAASEHLTEIFDAGTLGLRRLAGDETMGPEQRQRFETLACAAEHLAHWMHGLASPQLVAASLRAVKPAWHAEATAVEAAMGEGQ